ncbi:MAG: hypothetical protein SFV22_04140 [Saprospiraceae bacterium]|nr:hypothetical protein [Saprospiraceae bacterium]
MIATAIGLILMYSMLSLLSSTIKEIGAGVLALRGKMLDKALRRLLDTQSGATTQQGNATGTPPVTLYDQFKSHALFDHLKPNSIFGGVSSDMPSYLSGKTFASILLQILDGSTVAGLQGAIANLPEGKLKSFLQQTLTEAGNDIQKFKDQLELWYDTTMDRVTGWYKRQAQVILMGIGLVIAIGFNADTFSVYEKVSTDPIAQKAVLDAAQAYIDQGLMMPDTIRPDSVEEQIQALYIKTQDIINNNLSEVDSPLGLGWTDAEYQAFWAECGRTRAFWEKIIGFMVTALAISLGAPFWFDLLKRVTNLRNAGLPPASSSQPTPPA